MKQVKIILGDRIKPSVDKHHMEVLRKVWLAANEIATKNRQEFYLDIVGDSWFLMFGKIYQKKTNC
ncbi:hypothetical protein GNF18_02590 [Ligilactobacillus pobuzihii]|uniref:hypothetical protein n=1 Tax=Ligilactobacillus pobuzihii TaxID=449659 RepID=UPI0019CFC1DF|nr:hypothetical protein [Ligilactobacillus pobuzihii]MBN7274063.1 hypothetical protein [Ligilactobacillus pobuzihii]